MCARENKRKFESFQHETAHTDPASLSLVTVSKGAQNKEASLSLNSPLWIER